MPSEDERAAETAFTRMLLLSARRWRALADDAVRGCGLSEAAALILIVIDDLGGPPTQTVVARELGIEGPTLVRHVDRLVGMGLIERRDDPADRRVKTLALTRAGRKAVATIDVELRQLRRAALGGADPADVQAALRVFDVMRSYDGRAAGAASKARAGR